MEQYNINKREKFLDNCMFCIIDTQNSFIENIEEFLNIFDLHNIFVTTNPCFQLLNNDCEIKEVICLKQEYFDNIFDLKSFIINNSKNGIYLYSTYKTLTNIVLRYGVPKDDFIEISIPPFDDIDDDGNYIGDDPIFL